MAWEVAKSTAGWPGGVYVTLLWASLIVYRAYVLMMWALIGIPLDSCCLSRWALHQGNPQAFVCLPKSDSTQDRDPFFPLGEHRHGGVAVFADSRARLCCAIGDLLHGVFAVVMGGQSPEAPVGIIRFVRS